MSDQVGPNVLFVFTDQQRWDSVGVYGQSLDVTPNIDRLAVEGCRFEHAFTCQPVCGPARACVQTGKYATETGVFRHGIALAPSERTIAHYLSDAGYEVGYIGKWHLAATGTEPVPPELRGGYKDHWLAADVLEYTSHGYDGYLWDSDMQMVDFKGYRVDCLTDFALDHLKTREGGRPFFLFLSYLEPHHQNDRDCFEGPYGCRDRFVGCDTPGDLEGMEGDWCGKYPDYLACCESIDRNVGRLVDALGQLGLSDNTLVFYTSDHGCHFRTRNSEYKRSCHDSSLRVPMIAYGAGFTGGRVITDIVSLIDVAPTVLTACGVDAPSYMRGRPLQGLVPGTPGDWPQEAFAQISEDHVARAIRTHRWKYSVWAPGLNGCTESASDMYVEQCLYDLELDPHERRNLVHEPSYEGIRRELSEVLLRRISEAGEPTPQILASLDHGTV